MTKTQTTEAAYFLRYLDVDSKPLFIGPFATTEEAAQALTDTRDDYPADYTRTVRMTRTPRRIVHP